MPDKVAFATTNWENKPDKPNSVSQAEWDAWNSSKFSGFPFPTVEKDEEGNDFEQWDLVTKFQNKPSKSSSRRISVLGKHYSFKFTFDQLFQIFWRMSKVKPTVIRADGSEITGPETDYRDTTYLIGSTALIPSWGSNQKNLESKLVSELDTNYWFFDFLNSSCRMGIDFNMPVLKTAENEFRPFVECSCCQEACDGCGVLKNVLTTTSFIATIAIVDTPLTVYGDPCSNASVTGNYSVGDCGLNDFDWEEDVISREGNPYIWPGFSIGISPGSTLAFFNPDFTGDPSPLKCYVVLSFGGSNHYFLASGPNSVNLAGTYNGEMWTECSSIHPNNCPGEYHPEENGAPDACRYYANIILTIS